MKQVSQALHSEKNTQLSLNKESEDVKWNKSFFVWKYPIMSLR